MKGNEVELEDRDSLIKDEISIEDQITWKEERQKLKSAMNHLAEDQRKVGAVVLNVDYPGSHKWDAVAVSHEPTAKSTQPKGSIFLLSKL